MINSKVLISKKRLGEVLDFSIGNIDNMMKTKRIKYYKIGKNVRFDLNDIDMIRLLLIRG